MRTYGYNHTGNAWPSRLLRLGLAALLGLVGPACRDVHTPHTSIAREQMKAILIDLMIAEQSATLNANDQPARDSLARVYYHAVLAHYGIAPDEFAEVYYEYQHYPEYMMHLNKEIVEELSRELENPRYRTPIAPPQPNPTAAPNLGPDLVRRPLLPGHTPPPARQSP